MKVHPIKADARYTVTREWTGDQSMKPRHVARFCGEWIADASTYPAAVMLCTTHRCQRQGAFVATEIPANQAP